MLKFKYLYQNQKKSTAVPSTHSSSQSWVDRAMATHSRRDSTHSRFPNQISWCLRRPSRLAAKVVSPPTVRVKRDAQIHRSDVASDQQTERKRSKEMKKICKSSAAMAHPTMRIEMVIFVCDIQLHACLTVYLPIWKIETTKVVSNVDSKDDDDKDGFPEQVREMIEVFESREEMQSSDLMTTARKMIATEPDSVCLSSTEYYGLIVSTMLLLALLMTVAVIIGLLYR